MCRDTARRAEACSPKQQHAQVLTVVTIGPVIPRLPGAVKARTQVDSTCSKEDGMLSPLQKAKLTRLFAVLDGDQDQKLERSDYEQIVANLAKIRGWQRGSLEYNVLEALYLRIWDE